MLDLALIERGLLESSTTPMREAAHSEFAKLRMAIDGAIERDVLEGNAGPYGFHVVHVPSQWAHHRVLLVKCDD